MYILKYHFENYIIFKLYKNNLYHIVGIIISKDDIVTVHRSV